MTDAERLAEQIVEEIEEQGGPDGGPTNWASGFAEKRIAAELSRLSSENATLRKALEPDLVPNVNEGLKEMAVAMGEIEMHARLHRNADGPDMQKSYLRFDMGRLLVDAQMSRLLALAATACDGGEG